jgi:hypothetical protein
MTMAADRPTWQRHVPGPIGRLFGGLARAVKIGRIVRREVLLSGACLRAEVAGFIDIWLSSRKDRLERSPELTHARLVKLLSEVIILSAIFRAHLAA